MFWTADIAVIRKNFFLVPLVPLFVSFVSFDDHLMIRITRIFSAYSAYSAVSFIANGFHEEHESLLCSFASSVVFNRRQREKTQKLFSCPSLEPLYISAHFCVFCGSILSDFMYIFTFVFFVLSVGTPHHVRCFTHAFCTFIGGKFEVFFRDLNHKTTVRPP